MSKLMYFIGLYDRTKWPYHKTQLRSAFNEKKIATIEEETERDDFEVNGTFILFYWLNIFL